jgi:hypothetical protein
LPEKGRKKRERQICRRHSSILPYSSRQRSNDDNLSSDNITLEVDEMVITIHLISCVVWY